MIIFFFFLIFVTSREKVNIKATPIITEIVIAVIMSERLCFKDCCQSPSFLILAYVVLKLINFKLIYILDWLYIATTAFVFNRVKILPHIANVEIVFKI